MSRAGKLWGEDPDTEEKLYEAEGMAATYRTLANKHHEAIERDLGNESPTLLFPSTLLLLESQK